MLGMQDVKMVCWHPKGEVLVSCSYDDSIKVWIDSDGEWECAQTLAGPGLGHTSTVWGIAFDKEGRQMVSCSDDQTLRVWACSFDNPGDALPLLHLCFHQPNFMLVWHDLTCFGFALPSQF